MQRIHKLIGRKELFSMRSYTTRYKSTYDYELVIYTKITSFTNTRCGCRYSENVTLVNQFCHMFVSIFTSIKTSAMLIREGNSWSKEFLKWRNIVKKK